MPASATTVRRLRCTGPLALMLGAAPVLAAGPEREDPAHNIYIPPGDERAAVLYVAAEYDDERFYLHYRFETDDPSWYHQYWVYEEGDWVRYGRGAPGPDPDGLYEDRISMMLDDGTVEAFSRVGGWMTIHEGARTTTSEVSPDAVGAHPKLGEEMGRSDVRKYLPETRDVDDPGEASWDAVRTDEALEQLQAAGHFIDLWQWRAHRSHPLGYADNGYVLHDRLSSEGRAMFTDNWDDAAEQPAYMFDPDATGRVALDWDALVAREYGQDDPYFLSEDNAAPFDQEREWEEGDVIPQRILREPDGSRGAIRARGGYDDGAWRITLSRSLEAPDPRDSKALEPGEAYNVAFAVHTGQVGARWHLVSLPQTLGLGAEQADIVARPLDGAEPGVDPDWTVVQLAYPGQATWQWLHGEHTGSDLVHAGQIGVANFHDVDTLRKLIVGHEKDLHDTAREND